MSCTFAYIDLYMTISPIRIQFKTACELLDVSRETLRSLIRLDLTFPRPIKIGATKQAPVYFDYAELIEWHESQKKNLVEQEVLK